MKTSKPKAAVIAAVIATLALVAYGIDTEDPKTLTTVVRLVSDGQTVAELRIMKSAEVQMVGDIEVTTGTEKQRGTVQGHDGARLEISVAGGKSVTVSAEKMTFEMPVTKTQQK